MGYRVNSSAVLPFFLFVSAAIASWAYCITNEKFNGDFWPIEISLSETTLFLLLLATLAPFLIAWYLDKYLASRANKLKKVIVPKWFLEISLLTIFSWHILVTIVFNVGVMSQDVYSAPVWITPIIQIFNRIDPFYVGVFYILASPKRPINDTKAVLLIVSLGLLRAGLGGFLYAVVALSIKYHEEWLRFMKRRLLVVVLLLIIAPYTVGSLYDIRSSLRGEAEVALAASDLIAAKLAGRLSSYSNLAYIVQESNDFKASTQSLDEFYYPLQIAGRILTGSLSPSITPEKILINNNFLYYGNSTFMAGVPGNLILAWFVSPWVATANLAIMLVMIVATLKIAHRFGNGSASSFGVALLLYPLTSGVSYEFAVLLFNMLIIYTVCRIVGVMRSPAQMAPKF